MERDQTRKIRAISDDGREFVILEYCYYPDQQDGATRRIPVARAFVTEDCIPVHPVGEGLYEVLTDPEPALARPLGDA